MRIRGSMPVTNGSGSGSRSATLGGGIIIDDRVFQTVLRDPDPGSGTFLTPGSGSGMNNPDHISESLETIFGLKIL
jgi:hypothetical protein